MNPMEFARYRKRKRVPQRALEIRLRWPAGTVAAYEDERLPLTPEGVSSLVTTTDSIAEEKQQKEVAAA